MRLQFCHPVVFRRLGSVASFSVCVWSNALGGNKASGSTFIAIITL